MEEIRKINIKDKEYPKLLKEIPDPPETLYVKGKFIPATPKGRASLSKAERDELCFGVVGTRRFSSYGKQVALEITGDLAEAGLTIVSGLAPGIDTFAHQATVERWKPARNASATTSQMLADAGGRTIAVLGTGVDEKSIYPQSNVKLAKKIIETGGCLVSEYSPGTPGLKQNFPQRNRVISGLSIGVLVIEAKQKSGALITANYAFQQKRKVFAIPGSIYSSNSRGPHILIKRGAKLVENAQDILRELNLPGREKNKELKRETREEEMILHALRGGGLDIDKIIQKTKLSPQTVNSLLSILEVKGKIRNLGGGIFSLKRS